MTWTYSGDPEASSRDAVRFLMRDTDETSTATLSDEEIAWLVSESGGNLYLAAADGAVELAAKYAGLVQTKTVGSLSITYAARSQAFKTHSDNLRLRAARKTALAPSAGGISKSDKADMRSDTDWNQPIFQLGMDDYPGVEYVPNSTEF